MTVTDQIGQQAPTPYLETDGSGYGKLDRGNGGGTPTFTDDQRRGFLNGDIAR
jgi:hypothetical protein